MYPVAGCAASTRKAGNHYELLLQTVYRCHSVDRVGRCGARLAIPMEDQEIQTGARLTVRDSQMAVFVNEGRIADVFSPGLYTLSTHTLPLLTNLLNWDKAFKSPFKSDVYFFSSRLRIDQKWGTATPITIRDREFGAVRMRAYGIYAYRIADPRVFYEKVSGSREVYHV